MTKSYIMIKDKKGNVYNSWEESLIAPKFSIKNFADELHYYLRIYLRTNMSLTKIIMFLFLNAIQRILYTIGTEFIKIKFRIIR